MNTTTMKEGKQLRQFGKESSRIPTIAMPELKPGTKLSIQLSGYDEHLKTTFIGMSKNRFLIVSMPMLLAENRKIFFDYLFPDNRVAIRFLYEGEVYGFATHLIKYIVNPAPLIFLTYPMQGENISMRRGKRIDCLFITKIHTPGETLVGVIKNISYGGCQVTVNLKGEHKLDVGVGDKVMLECENLGMTGDDPVCCRVRRLGGSESTGEVGLEFRDLNESAGASIGQHLLLCGILPCSLDAH